MAVAVKPMTSGPVWFRGSARLQKVLLACGIVSSLLYVAMNFVGALLYPGYSLASQTISELYAIGAPPRVLVASLMVVYNLLLYAFGVGVWRSAGGTRALRVASAAGGAAVLLDASPRKRALVEVLLERYHIRW